MCFGLRYLGLRYLGLRYLGLRYLGLRYPGLRYPVLRCPKPIARAKARIGNNSSSSPSERKRIREHDDSITRITTPGYRDFRNDFRNESE